MNNYEALEDFIVQLTGDSSEARYIIEQTIGAALELEIPGDKVAAFIVVTIRNKCADYNRWREEIEVQAEALGTSVGNVKQAVRAIQEGRYFQ